jgi:hypothetical protein
MAVYDGLQSVLHGQYLVQSNCPYKTALDYEVGQTLRIETGAGWCLHALESFRCPKVRGERRKGWRGNAPHAILHPRLPRATRDEFPKVPLVQAVQFSLRSQKPVDLLENLSC